MTFDNIQYDVIYGDRGIAPTRDCAHERNLSLYGVLVQYAVSRLRGGCPRAKQYAVSRLRV